MAQLTGIGASRSPVLFAQEAVDFRRDGLAGCTSPRRRSWSYNSLPIVVIPAKPEIQRWKRRRMLPFRPWMPAFAGMTSNGKRRHRHRRGPSVSRHARIHPTDALGARRYEKRDSER